MGIEKPAEPVTPAPSAPAKGFVDPEHGFDDGREPWEWESRYPGEAKARIKLEATIAAGYLLALLLLTFISAGFIDQSFTGIDPLFGKSYRFDVILFAVFLTGALGGTTFSIKWLMHSVATGKWHVDRFYWRIFVPLVGGVYAVVVLNLFSSGLIGGGVSHAGTSPATMTALAFLVGYFSDGVSGLLTNVAKAVFGTVEKK